MGVELGVRALDRARVTVSGEAHTDEECVAQRAEIVDLWSI